jgi:alcohol dehydrogenase class IV
MLQIPFRYFCRTSCPYWVGTEGLNSYLETKEPIMASFEFATAGRIIFGEGVLNQAAPATAALGRRALVVTGANRERAQALLDALAGKALIAETFSVPGEPTVDHVRRGVDHARATGCDVIIGFGGGSALDAAKAIAALLTNRGDPLDYLEVIGRGQALEEPAAPCIAIPTTAGTGSEVTRNAVLAAPEHRVKVSLRSPSMLPRLAIVDPLLTHSMSPHVTAHTGMDALIQNLEPLVSSQANPLTDGIAREGLRRAAHSLRWAFEENDPQARENMALASLFGGLALANAKLGAVHGFAGVLGGMFSAPHGAVCAALLAPVMQMNVRALRARAPRHPALERYAEIAALFTGQADADPVAGVEWVQDLTDDLDIAGLATYGVTAADIPAIVEKSANSSSMKGNPLPLTPGEMQEILRRSL